MGMSICNTWFTMRCPSCVSNPDSAFYRSDTFERIITFATNSYQRCKLDENRGHRRMIVNDVPTVEAALLTLRRILGDEKL